MGLGLPEATLITGLTSAAATGASAALAGGGGGKPIELPPDMEAEQVEVLEQQLADFEIERTRNQEAVRRLEGIADLQIDVASALVPDKDKLRQLTQQTQELALMFGDEIPEVISGVKEDLAAFASAGFDVEADIREQIAQTVRETGREYKDPTVERNIEEGRTQLEERLAMQLGPGYSNTEAGIRALQAFEQGATEMRYNVSKEGRAAEASRLGALAGAAATTSGSIAQRVGSRLQFGQLLFTGREQAGANLMSGLSAPNIGLNTLIQARELGRSGVEMAEIPMRGLQAFGSQELSRDIQRAIEQRGFGDGRFTSGGGSGGSGKFSAPGTKLADFDINALRAGHHFASGFTDADIRSYDPDLWQQVMDRRARG